MNWRPFTIPATLPVTRIFFHYPTRTLPEVKKPYSSQPGVKGRMAPPKRMNFRKNSKRLLTPLPPPHFWKIILRILRQKCVCSLWRDCYYVLYDPISHEMHVVQQFNMVIG